MTLLVRTTSEFALVYPSASAETQSGRDPPESSQGNCCAASDCSLVDSVDRYSAARIIFPT
jgi:hypothetical protein